MHRRDAEAMRRSRDLPRATATVDGGEIAYVRVGEGRPPIVLLAGAGMDIDSWAKVLPGLAELGTVVAIDRPGVGRSDPPTRPQAGAVVVDTVRATLAQAGLAPPSVVVAHSLGGLIGQLWTRTHPAEVAGLVLIESASLEEAADPPTPGRFGRILSLLQPRSGDRGLAEVDLVDRTAAELEAAPPFPATPLVVVTGGARMRFVPEAAFAAHRRAQDGLAAMSPRGRQVVAERSGHFPQLQEPDVVVGAVRDVIAAGRA